MRVTVSKKYDSLNAIHKDCLKNTDNIDFIDEYDDLKIRVIDDDSRVLGEVQGFLTQEKAGVLITHLHSDCKTLKEKEEVLKCVVDTIWNSREMNHYTLAIHVYTTESGIDYSILEHMGFVGRAGAGSEYYTMFNPNFLDMVDGLAPTNEDKERLLKLYNTQQKRKQKQLRLLDDSYRSIEMVLGDLDKSSSEYERQERDLMYYQEAVLALGNTDLLESNELSDSGSKGPKF